MHQAWNVMLNFTHVNKWSLWTIPNNVFFLWTVVTLPHTEWSKWEIDICSRCSPVVVVINCSWSCSVHFFAVVAKKCIAINLQSVELIFNRFFIPTCKIFAVPPWAPEVSVSSTLWKGVLLVTFARTSWRQTRAFSVVGPSMWNGLPLVQRLILRVHPDTFYSSLRTVLFSRARVWSASWVVTLKRLYINLCNEWVNSRWLNHVLIHLRISLQETCKSDVIGTSYPWLLCFKVSWSSDCTSQKRLSC